MPDLIDANYGLEYPHRPYKANPHMHPGELTLVRSIGQGRWQHPFHEHADHVRILGRDGNLILSATANSTDLAGPLMFNTDTTPGQAFEGDILLHRQGNELDMYGHDPSSADARRSCRVRPMRMVTTPARPRRPTTLVVPGSQQAAEVAPTGDVSGGGPATLPIRTS